MTLDLTTANAWEKLPSYQGASRVLLQAPAGVAYDVGFYQDLPGIPAADTAPVVLTPGDSVELSTAYSIYCKAIPADAAGEVLYSPLA